MFKQYLNATLLCLTIALVIPETVIGMGSKKPTLDKATNNDISVNVKVENGNKKIVFYNSDSTIKKEIKAALYPSISPDKNRIAVIEISSKDSVSIYNRYGCLSYRFKTPKLDTNQFSFNVNKIAVSNNGSIITVGENHGMIFSRTISFYDSSLKHMADVKIDYIDPYVIFIDDDLVVVLLEVNNKIDKFPAMEYTTIAELRVYQTDGKLMWKHLITDLNTIGVDSTGMTLAQQGIEVLYCDYEGKRIYVKGISNLGETYKELWQKYEKEINPQGKTIWMFDFKGKLIQEKRGW